MTASRLLIGAATSGLVPVVAIDANGQTLSIAVSAENAISAAHGLASQGRAVIAKPEEWREALDQNLG